MKIGKMAEAERAGIQILGMTVVIISMATPYLWTRTAPTILQVRLTMI